MATEPAPAEEAPHQLERGSGGREILLAALATAFLFASFLVLPLAGSLALPLVAVPSVRLTHRRGLPAGLAAACLAVAGLAALSLATAGGSEAAMLAFVGAAVTALPAAAAAAVRRGLRPSLAYLGLCVAGSALLAGGLLARSESEGRPMQREIAAAFDQMAQAVQSNTQAGGDGEAAARLKATLSGARDFAEKFWAGLVGASWVIGAAIGFYAGARWARPAPSAEATRFERLSVPAPVVALFVAAGAGLALAPHPAREVAGNLLLPLASLYFVAGLSIICHFARKWFRGRILRVGLYALAIYFPVSVGVGLLGLFDWYADFRRRGEGAIEKS